MRRFGEKLVGNIICGLLFSMLGLPLAAQPRDPLVRVPALRYLDHSGYAYTVGEPFKVNVDYSRLNDVEDFGKLRARIFRGTYDNLTRVGRKSVGNCASFFSTVLKPNESDGGIDFGLNFDEHWLRPSGTSGLIEEHYILVFELDGPEGRWLDLEKDSVDRYFQQGFFFTVQPDRSVRPEEARRLVTEMRGQGKQLRETTLKRQQVASEGAAAPAAGSTPEMIRCWRLRLVRSQVSELSSFDPVECEIEEYSRMRRGWFSRFLGVSRQREDSSASSAGGAIGE